MIQYYLLTFIFTLYSQYSNILHQILQIQFIFLSSQIIFIEENIGYAVCIKILIDVIGYHVIFKIDWTIVAKTNSIFEIKQYQDVIFNRENVILWKTRHEFFYRSSKIKIYHV